jgi:hypothetical protein
VIIADPDGLITFGNTGVTRRLQSEFADLRAEHRTIEPIDVAREWRTGPPRL